MKKLIITVVLQSLLFHCKAAKTEFTLKSSSLPHTYNDPLNRAINSGACNVLALKNSIADANQTTPKGNPSTHDFWSMRPFVGTYYLGQFYLLQKWMGHSVAPFDGNRYAKILIASQLENGGWLAIHDHMVTTLSHLAGPENYDYGELDPTLFIYWSLRAMKTEGDLSPKLIAELQEKSVLENAHKFIHARYTVKKQDFSTLTKLFLALFENYHWEHVVDRRFIHEALGIDAVPLWFAKGKLDFLGLGPRSLAQWVPAFVLPVSYITFARLSRNVGPGFDLKNVFKLRSPAASTPLNMATLSKSKRQSIAELITIMLKGQGPKGSFSGYTLHSHINALVLDHYASHVLKCDDGNAHRQQCLKIDNVIQKAMRFTQTLYFDSAFVSTKAHPQKEAADSIQSYTSGYLGATCDGTFWDTTLIGQALAYAGVPPKNLAPAIRFSIAQQQRSKPFKGFRGFPFGWDFWQFPDNDDTAEFLLFLHSTQSKRSNNIDPRSYLAPDHLHLYTQGSFPRNKQYNADLNSQRNKSIRDAVGYLVEMQNHDGGWGAFAHENYGNFILSYFSESLKDTADLFDESSVDVTGHVLEALGSLGFRPSSWRLKKSSIRAGKTIRVSHRRDNFIQKAMHYIEKRQAFYYVKVKGTSDFLLNEKGQIVTAKGPWFGRWGINYIYGTHAAVNGLAKFYQDPMQSDAIRNAVTWLEQIQNDDGGFGETNLSYTRKAPNAFMGVGISTASQTAWALSTLVAAGQAKSKAARAAAAYLIGNIEKHGRWIDSSSVATGLPGIVSMHYPSYAYAFPLMALSQYRAQINPAHESSMPQCSN